MILLYYIDEKNKNQEKFYTPLVVHTLYQHEQGGIVMDTIQLYNDIKARTNGEIYMGVVGPVRSGKSTFIKRFMDVLVLPHIEDENDKKRTHQKVPLTTSNKFLKYTLTIEALSISLSTVQSTVIIVLSFSITLILPTTSPFFTGAFISSISTS